MGVPSPAPSPGLHSTPILSSIVFGLPQLVVPLGVRQTSTDLELLSVVLPAVGQGTASVHYRNRPFTRLGPITVSLLGADRAGRHRNRRTGGNHSVLSLIPIGMYCCLSVSVADCQSHRNYRRGDYLRVVGFSLSCPVLRLKPQGFSLTLINPNLVKYAELSQITRIIARITSSGQTCEERRRVLTSCHAAHMRIKMIDNRKRSEILAIILKSREILYCSFRLSDHAEQGKCASLFTR
ncbi:MAG: hypothetical protein J07HQW2_02406 [Haloquadratum walsbyi J07HQW2]|uniref:Uncharacterized protein n=1 Tax=Haloquadratum walsbyi J07HQW2 TaxID=1238425 RepID=U1NFS9_9EURY|nr:MAG: hypothetical protein J07HQW2_02406 [Haloquadratum walsbyi J07HQW2]